MRQDGRYFRLAEFNCKCSRADCDAPKYPHTLLLRYLDQMREMYGGPLYVTSGNRCAVHNAAVGGAQQSEHLSADGCLGADLACPSNEIRWRMLEAAMRAGFTRIGIYAKHLHVGVGDMVAETYPKDRVWVG